MFQFANWEYLYLLIILPIVGVIFLLGRRARQKALKEFGESNLIKDLMPEASRVRPWLKLIVVEVALMLAIIALAGPQFGTKLREAKREGIELVIALDISNSMLAEDIAPSRLENAKRAISKLVDRLHNDKIALVVFAGDAYVQLPLTTDYSAAKMFMGTISPKLITNQGTEIGSAIELAMKSFSPSEENNKAIVIITDGEDHEERAVEMAAAANEQGIKVYTIGMGLKKGAPIPIYNKYGQKDYRTDKQGNVVISKLNEKMLREIASAGGGKSIRANNTKTGLNALFDEFKQLDKVEMEAKVYSEYEEQYQYFLGFAILFLVVEFFILFRKNRQLNRINLFKGELLGKKSEE